MDAQTRTLNILFKRCGPEFRVCATAYSRKKIADIYWDKSVTEIKVMLVLQLELQL